MPTLPSTDAKIGKKIDYVASVLGERLKPLGFTRRARVFQRTVGTGNNACVQLVDIQGDKWNEGSRGKFTINFGAGFPALFMLLSRLPGLEWIADELKGTPRPGIGPGCFSGRLGDVVPNGARDPRWPVALRHGEDFWAEIDSRTDLGALAESVATVVVDHAPSWFDTRSRLAAFGQPALAHFGSPSRRDAVLAALLDGKRELAAQRARDVEPHGLASDEKQFAGLLDLLRDNDIDIEGLAWAQPMPDPMHTRRSADVAMLREQHEARVERYLRDNEDWQGREDVLLDAWVDAAAAGQSEPDARKLPLWQTIAPAPVEARRRLLLRSIARLDEPGVAVKSTIANVWATYDDYNLHAWSVLAAALLATDDAPCEAPHASALLQALAATAHRVVEELTFDRFVAPVADAIRWLGKRTDAGTRHAVRPQMTALLGAIRIAAIERCRKRHANPPRADLLGAELADPLAAAFTPEAAARMEALYERFPERAYGGADRDAVLLLKRWARADVDGRVPLAIEDDDWGRELAQAVDELRADVKPTVLHLLEWFDDGVDTKPSKAWSAELARRAAGVDREAWVHWLSGTLPRFARTTLGHVAATPGTGAFPGETSGRALLGMIHLVGHLDAPELTPTLQLVVAAAWTVVPDVRVRAQGVGSVCVALLARSIEGREFLAGLRKTTKQKPLRGAIEKALDG